MRITLRTSLLLLSIVLFACSGGLFACGGGDSGGSGGSGGSGTSGSEDEEDFSDLMEDEEQAERVSAREAIGVRGPEVPWAEMTREQREWDMVGRFHPIMREVFQEHDARLYEEFECSTCHGSNAHEVNYQMPNPQLPAIGAPDSPSYQNLRNAVPAAVTFMEEQVTPTMRTLLGIEDFGCNGCHRAPASEQAANTEVNALIYRGTNW